MKETIEIISKTKIWIFEKINKIEKGLARLINKKRKRMQIYEIRNEKEVTTEIKGLQQTTIHTHTHTHTNWTTLK